MLVQLTHRTWLKSSGVCCQARKCSATIRGQIAMFFIAVTGLMTFGIAIATVYETIAAREIPWLFVGCGVFFAVLFIASLLIFS